jgi:hypothetical protein
VTGITKPTNQILDYATDVEADVGVAVWLGLIPISDSRARDPVNGRRSCYYFRLEERHEVKITP